jgi:GT2 family glycosyltransferase
VIVPARDGSHHLERCLAAVRSQSYVDYELIVADDGSIEDLAAPCERFRAAYAHVPGGPRGPAAARNHGARFASGTVLFFVDADCVLDPAAVGLAVRAIEDGADAAIGSYDDSPDDPGLISQFKNLYHRYVHQRAESHAETFWTGCGAIRAEVFRSLGGFDEALYPRPSIEDIELGVRLRRSGGAIRMLHAMQVKHLKRWTLAGLIRTDVRDRAIPWTRLIMREGRVPATLNLAPRDRLSALLALAAPLALLLPGRARLAAPAALGVFLGLNADLYRFFAAAGGPAFAARCLPLHVLYCWYSAVGAGIGVALGLLDRRRG